MNVISKNIQNRLSKGEIIRHKKRLMRIISLSRLKNHDFCIVSNNCWGSGIYHDLQFQYNTPFVGLFLYSSCYIRLLSDLKYYLKQQISFLDESRYPIANKLRVQQYFPTGIIGDVEIQFLHYKTKEEASEKWSRRCARMNLENLFIGYSDVDLFEKQHLEIFENLSFKHKVFFTANDKYNTPSSVWISECSGQPYVANLSSNAYLYKRHFDMIDWLNGGSGKPTALYRLVNKILETK